jgi:hypothetical protein
VAQDWPKSGAPLVGKGALVPLTPTLATAVATAGSRTPKSKLEEGNKDTVLIWHISVLINDYHAEASSLIFELILNIPTASRRHRSGH